MHTFSICPLILYYIFYTRKLHTFIQCIFIHNCNLDLFNVYPSKMVQKFTYSHLKPKYSSIFSIEPKDFKNVIFEKIGWALFEVAEVARMKLSRIKKTKGTLSQKPFKISSKTIFLHLRPRGCPFDLNGLRRGSVNFNENYIFEIKELR